MGVNARSKQVIVRGNNPREMKTSMDVGDKDRCISVKVEDVARAVLALSAKEILMGPVDGLDDDSCQVANDQEEKMFFKASG